MPHSYYLLLTKVTVKREDRCKNDSLRSVETGWSCQDARNVNLHPINFTAIDHWHNVAVLPLTRQDSGYELLADNSGADTPQDTSWSVRQGHSFHLAKISASVRGLF